MVDLRFEAIVNPQRSYCSPCLKRHTMNYKYDYFISYAQEDVKDGFIGEFVERLAKNPDLEALLGAEPRVFFDQEAARNMDEWDDAVQAAIDASRVLIVLLSPNYFKSERCAMEFARWFEGAERGALPYTGIAPFQIADVFDDGPVDVPQELQDRFPNWASVLRKSQIFADFDLRDRSAASIDRALAALGGPYLSDAYMELGCSSAMAGDDKQAREHFAKALEIAKKAFERAPDDPKAMSSLRAAYGSLGVVLASEGDYKQARELYERALEIAQKALEQTPDDPKALNALRAAYVCLGDLAAKERDFARARDYFAQMQEGFQKILMETPDDLEALHGLSDVYARLGDLPIRESEDDVASYRQAREYYEKAFEGFQKILERTPNDLEALNGLADICAKLGCLLLDMNALPDVVEQPDQSSQYKDDYGQAREYLAKAEEGFQKILEETPDDLEALRDLANVCNRLGDLSRTEAWLTTWAENKFEEPDFTQAVEFYGKAEEGFQKILEKAPADLRTLHNLSGLRITLGVVSEGKHEYEEAQEYFTKASEGFQKILEREPDSLRALRDLADVCERLGEVARRMDDRSQAQEYFAKAVEGFETLLEKAPDNLEALRRLVEVYEQLGDLAEREADPFKFNDEDDEEYDEDDEEEGEKPDFTQAREYFAKALKIRKKIVELSPNDLEPLRDLSNACERLGDLAKKEGDFAEAREYFTKGLKAFERVLEQTPNNFEALSCLYHAQGCLGELSKLTEDYEQEKLDHEKALEIALKTLKRARNDRQALSDASRYCEELGRIARKEDDDKRAIKHFKKALEMRKKIIKRTPDDVETLSAMGDVYFILDDMLQWGDEDRGRECAEKGFEIRKKVVDLAPNDVGALRALSLAYRRIGVFLQDDAWEENEEEPDFTQTQEYYAKAVETANKAVDCAPDDLEALKALSDAYCSLGEFLARQISTEQASEYYQQGLEKFKKIVEQAPDSLQALHGLSDLYRKLGELSDGGQARERYEKALEANAQIIAHKPNDYKALYDMGWIYVNELGALSEKEGDLVQTKEYYEKGIEAYKKNLEFEPYAYATSRALGYAYRFLADLLKEEEEEEDQE